MRAKPMNLVGRAHEALHCPAEPVADLDAAAFLADRMAMTLERIGNRGLALAAPQVGRSLQLVVTRQTVSTVVNPVIVRSSGRELVDEEGCLSLPGRWFMVPRWTEVEVEGVDLDGKPVGFRTTDAKEARMWAHELEHLAGLLLLGRFEEVRG